MSNYYKTISVASLTISDGVINQKNETLEFALNGNTIVELKDDNAYIKSNRILTTGDFVKTGNNFIINTTFKISFGSGIYLESGPKYLRYCGNCESGYDTALSVSNVYNTPFPAMIKKISIQKGYSGETVINIPAINYSKTVSGNFFIEDINADIGIGEKIYVEIIGDPSLETMVEIYIIENDNVLEETPLELTNTRNSTFHEVFTNQDGVTTTQFSIAIA
jgi:hypothetical protein